eukprot:2953972-Pyramimonas_sp.AAC.1
MANRRLLLTPFERKRFTGHHQHASACRKDLARAAQYSPKMLSLFVDAVQIAHDMFLVNRDPFHDQLHLSSVMTQLSLGVPTVRSWGHPQGDGGVLHVRA